MVVALLILTGNGSGFNFERLANAVKQAARPAALLRPVALCAHHFYVLHEPAEAVVKLGEQCRDMIRSYAGVPSTYMQQIGDLSLAKQWKQIDVPVLVIYGTSDPATSADEGRYLVEIINTFHPGRASFVELPGMGHDFARYSSEAEFLRRRQDSKAHPFDGEVLVVLTKWIEEQSHT